MLLHSEHKKGEEVVPHQSLRPRVPRSRRLIACAFACAMVLPAASWAVDWGKPAVAAVSLFYPGRLGWGRVLAQGRYEVPRR